MHYPFFLGSRRVRPNADVGSRTLEDVETRRNETHSCRYSDVGTCKRAPCFRANSRSPKIGLSPPTSRARQHLASFQPRGLERTPERQGTVPPASTPHARAHAHVFTADQRMKWLDMHARD